MSEKNLHIVNGNLVSKEILLAYLRGELNQSEKLRLEKLIREDVFLQDAVEGLQGKDPVVIERALNNIYNKINTYTAEKKSFTISPAIKKYAAAASFLFFLAITLLVMDRLNKNVADQKVVASEQDLIKDEKYIRTDTVSPDSDMGGGSIMADSMEDINEEELITYNQKRISIDAESASDAKDFEPVINTDFSVTEEVDLSEDIAVVTELKYEEVPSSRDSELSQKGTDLQKSTSTTSGESKSKTVTANDNGFFKTDKKKKNMDGDAKSESAAYEAFDLDDAVSDTTEISLNSKLPQFPGGSDSLNNYLAKFIQNTESYSTIEKNSADEDRNVNIKFLVNEDGSISNAFLTAGIGEPYDTRALNAVQSMPKWIPAQKDGVNIKIWYTLVVKF